MKLYEFSGLVWTLGPRILYCFSDIFPSYRSMCHKICYLKSNYNNFIGVEKDNYYCFCIREYALFETP